MKTRPTNRNAWLLAPILCAALLAFAAWRAQGPAYKRFVSPPLADGTRYTFLYPARYNSVSGIGTNALLLDDETRRLTLLDRIRQYIPLGPVRATLAGLRAGEITVQVDHPRQKRANSRTEIKESRRRFISIEDARSRSYFFVSHINYFSEPTRFDAESKVFSQSFQILPRGAPIPAP